MRALERLVAAATLALVVPPFALGQAPLLEFSGGGQGDDFGASIDGGVDVDQDGVPDYAIGAPGHSVASVHSGADGRPLFEFTSFPNSAFGSGIAFAGDGDGDGYPDVIVGAKLDSSSVSFSGAARVFSGFDGSILLARFGAQTHDALGTSVAGGGDVDLDGFADVAVGEPHGNHPGKVRVYSVKTGVELMVLGAAEAVPGLGIDLQMLPDQDLDGRPEILVGAETSLPGAVLLYSGTGALRRKFTPPPGALRFGFGIASAGDLDGDGVADIAFPLFSGTGNTIFAYSGATLAPLHALPNGFWSMGKDVAGIGDYDGDGRDDLAVGAPLNLTAQAGLAFVLSGATGATIETLAGTLPVEEFGRSVARAGDLDGDGAPEVMVGSPSIGGLGLLRGHAAVLGACGGGITLAHGGGCAFNALHPRLNILGCPAPSATLEVSVEQGLPGGAALLVVGSSLADLPIGNGCTLNLSPWLTQVVVPLDPAGFLRLDVSLPPGFHAYQFVVQAFSPAPNSPVGYAMTNAVAVKVP